MSGNVDERGSAPCPSEVTKAWRVLRRAWNSGLSVWLDVEDVSGSRSNRAWISDGTYRGILSD